MKYLSFEKAFELKVLEENIQQTLSIARKFAEWGRDFEREEQKKAWGTAERIVALQAAEIIDLNRRVLDLTEKLEAANEPR